MNKPASLFYDFSHEVKVNWGGKGIIDTDIAVTLSENFWQKLRDELIMIGNNAQKLDEDKKNENLVMDGIFILIDDQQDEDWRYSDEEE